MTSKIRIGCLHAHHSNIAYIDKALALLEAEPLHFVDPGLVHRIASDPAFTADHASQKIREQLAWIAGCNTDALLITCTNYIAAMKETDSPPGLPVVKIDEPFFAELCANDTPKRLVFTNPATVNGTLARLAAFAKTANWQPHIATEVIPDSFELVMQGKQQAYRDVVREHLIDLQQRLGWREQIWAAQLSMVDAANEAVQKTGQKIGDPLNPLARSLERLVSELQACL